MSSSADAVIRVAHLHGGEVGALRLDGDGRAVGGRPGRVDGGQCQ
jgi:hypothetical protein